MYVMGEAATQPSPPPTYINGMNVNSGARFRLIAWATCARKRGPSLRKLARTSGMGRSSGTVTCTSRCPQPSSDVTSTTYNCSRVGSDRRSAMQDSIFAVPSRYGVPAGTTDELCIYSRQKAPVCGSTRKKRVRMARTASARYARGANSIVKLKRRESARPSGLEGRSLSD